MNDTPPVTPPSRRSDRWQRVGRRLAAEQSLWRYALENTGYGLWEYDIEQDHFICSESYAALLGYRSADLIGPIERIIALIHPEDLAERARWQDPERHQYVLESEPRLRCANGDYRWFLSQSLIVRDEAGNSRQRLLGLLSDITESKQTELALRQNEGYLRDILENTPLAIAVTQPDGSWMGCNQRFIDLLGYQREDFSRDMSLWRCTHPEDRAQDRIVATDIARGQRRVTMEKRFIHKNGAVVHAQVDMSILTNPGGDLRVIVIQIQDITERLAQQEALFQEKQLAQITLAAIGDGVVRTDTQGLITYCNAAALSIRKGTEASLEGRAFDAAFRFADELGQPLPRSDLMTAALGGQAVGRKLLLLHACDGKIRPVECTSAPLHDGHGALIGCVAVLHDVSEAHALAGELRYQQQHDALTGLANRRAFEARLESWLNVAHDDGSVHAVLLMDLDNFKLVNDTCGHSSGDQLLKQISVLMCQELPGSQAVARLGGDEFAVLLEHCSADAAANVAQHLINVISSKVHEVDRRKFWVGISIGISTLNAQTLSIHQALSEADTACYVAKRRGRNRSQIFHRSDRVLSQTHQELDWATRIDDALRENRLQLFAQHIVDLNEPRRTVAYELLIRMIEPDGEVILPDVFLPAARHFRMMGRIEQRIIRLALTALKQAERDQAAFEYFSVNLSGTTLCDEEHADFLIRELEESGVTPAKLRFEIVETDALTDLPVARQLIAKLKSHGFKFMLDDFGTGFTSFEHLRSLGIDGLKIDYSFVHTLATDVVNQSIVEFCVGLAGKLKIEVVAEGVESEDAAAALLSRGVRLAQGWLFHKPEPLEQALSR